MTARRRGASASSTTGAGSSIATSGTRQTIGAPGSHVVSKESPDQKRAVSAASVSAA